MAEVQSHEAARRFARSLNILLKTIRLYGAEHERTTDLLGAAWQDLQTALQEAGKTGLLLGVSGAQVLLDGVPLEKRPTDRSFAQLLSTAGLASIHFSPRVTSDDFWRFARAFTSRPHQAGSVAVELRAALGGDDGAIRVNEVRFVAQDASLPDTSLAAHLAARALGPEAKRLNEWLNDPQRLLQLIAAAEGAHTRPGGAPGGGGGQPGTRGTGQPGAAGAAQAGPGRPGPAAAQGAPVLAAPPAQEKDVLQVLRWLSQVGHTAQVSDSPDEVSNVEKQVRQLPAPSQAALTEALTSLASQSEPPRPGAPLLLQLAERVAIRFALEQYERGDVKTNAVVEMLDRLKREIGSLRQILKVHEEQMGRAGMEVDTHAEILDREFWAGVPPKHKQKILLSPEAWAIPPRNIRQFVSELIAKEGGKSARDILENYAQCVHAHEADAKRKAASGLTELADLYAQVDVSLLKTTLHHLGEELRQETNSELQTLLDAGFVRHSHEAAARRQYPAVNEALAAMEALERTQPGHARILWPRVKVGNPLGAFIDEALRVPHVPEGLVEVLRRTPQATVDQVASRSPHCTRREEWERLLELTQGVGPEAVTHLRKILQNRPATEAAARVGLLSRLEPTALEELLPLRLRDWDQIAHDQVVRQLATSLSPRRGKLLEGVFDLLDSAVLAEAVDEIGMCGDRAPAPRLMRIVEKESKEPAQPYLQLKAIEALGRLREPNACPLLRLLAESRRLWSWRYPRELRITAVQALMHIDPEWAERFLPRCGLSTSELNLAPLDATPDTPYLRHRRYVRMNLPKPLKGAVRTNQGNCHVAVQQLSLGGGVARSQSHIRPGSAVGLELRCGFRSIHADVLVREARPQEMTFELVKIGLEDRHRLRAPLLNLQARVS